MSTETKPARRVFFREAICAALMEEMQTQPDIVILGQDVGSFGGSYREFDGLFAAFGPERVRDTPVAEAAMVGIGAGAAAAGLKPIISITYMDFLMLGLDPLVNYAAKLKYKTSGALTAPMVVKTTAGAKGQGVAHSQCIEAWLMAVPGLKVVAPSNPADAYALMRAAINDPGPVVYIDHKKLFPIPGALETSAPPARIGEAAILREGTDLTLATHAYMTRVAAEAAERAGQRGISCEVVDLRSLAPLDVPTLQTSVDKTGRLLTLEEGQATCGVGVEVAQRLREAGSTFTFRRLGALAAPVSSNPVLEAACVPDADQVLAAIEALARQPRRTDG